jgi:hypothetical protein
MLFVQGWGGRLGPRDQGAPNSRVPQLAVATDEIIWSPLEQLRRMDLPCAWAFTFVSFILSLGVSLFPFN